MIRQPSQRGYNRQLNGFAVVLHEAVSHEEPMVLTKPELIASLQNEVRILLHLADKLTLEMLDYRPTPKQRSALEVLQYMTIMGPALVQATIAGDFEGATWSALEQAAFARSFAETRKALAAQSQEYADLLGPLPDDFFRGDIEMFGQRSSRGAFLVNMVIGGHAAYRTQLFLYLKSCGRSELSTMNLWAGADAPA
jgi:hypothetical protein